MQSERRVSSDWASRLLWLLGVILLTGVALYVVWTVRNVIALMLVCGAISYLLMPLVDWLTRWRPPGVTPLFWRGFVSMLVVAGFTVLSIYALVLFISPFVREARDFLRDLPQYQQRIENTINAWQTAYHQWYEGLSPSAQNWLDQQVSALSESLNRTTSDLQLTVRNALQRTGSLIELIVELFLVPIIVFYLLFDSHRLKRETLRWIPPRYVRTTLAIIYETNRVMRAYIVGQLILGIIAGIATWIGIHLMGIKYAVTLALFAGIARAIPVIGPVIAAFPIVIMGLIQGGIGLGVQVALFMTILFFVEHKVIMPKIIGDRVDLHPVLVILVLLISGKFFHLIGMFFGVPVAVIVRNVVIAQRRRMRRTPRVVRLPVYEAPERSPTQVGGQ